MEVNKFKPETYFNRTGYLEVTIANAIYHEGKKKVKEYVQPDRTGVNRPETPGFTYLLYSIRIEKYDMTKALLEFGVNPSQLSIIKHPDGGIEKLAPLVCIYRNRWYSIKYIKLLAEEGMNVNDTTVSSPLATYIINSGKDQKRVRYLIESGANINLVFGDCVPVQHAILSRRLGLVDLLWSCGTDPLYIGKKENSLTYMT